MSLIGGMVLIGCVSGAQENPAPPVGDNTSDQKSQRIVEPAQNTDGARLLQLLRSRPEWMSLLENYYSQYLAAAGEKPAPENVTDQAVVERIRTDPAFARSASQWLLELAAQASASLQLSEPSEMASRGTTSKPSNAAAGSERGAEQASADVKPSLAAQLPTQAIDAQPVVPAAAFDPAGPSPVTQSNRPDRYLAQTDLTVRNFPKFFAQDQLAFWTQPLHSDVQSLSFWVPASFATAALMGSDTDIESHLPTSPNTVKIAANGSTAGMAALVGVGGGLYLLGKINQNPHQLEAGYLIGEAALDAYVASTSMQYMTQRERPFTGNGKGQFFDGGNSFPSNTAAVSWAAASVLAHEYPGVFTKLLAYGVAAGVSAGRVIGEKHWASDAVIGSALGWYMGRQIYRARSQGPEIDATNWGLFEKSSEEKQRDPDYMASTYIPLDSWIYPAFDRLAALGYVPTEIIAIRPWARSEGARLVLEAQAHISEGDVEPDAVVRKTLTELRHEFAFELQTLEGHSNLGAQLESAYLRVTPIAGRPLRDSFNFAQTLYDDFGRPYGQGFNAIAGVSARAETGPLAFYFRGEYEYSNGMAPYSPYVSQQIANFNDLPVNSVPTFPQQSQFRTIEAYMALDVHNWQLSFGQQTLFLSPDFGGSLLLSNNAQAGVMLRLSRTVPYELPEPFSWLGKIRNTIFVGALPNYNYVRGPYPTFQPLYGNPYQNLNPLPYTWGDKLALKMTENLEVGVGLTVIWAGYSRPATAKTWLHTFSTQGNAQTLDPGKRYTGINVSYRVPKLRDWMVFYVDGMANDEPNPIAYPLDSAFNPGLYFPKLPKLPNIDLRLEGVYTNIVGYPGTAPYYSNNHYPQGYTTYWQLMGDWVGRQGDGWQATSTYWWSATRKLQLSYRRQYNDKVLLEGGNLNDFAGTINWAFHKDFLVASTLQYERWNFPLLASGPQSDVAFQLQFTYWPGHVPDHK
ncbi:MAG: capsule assembly Wzi family protein [Candidatus Korobacteraceae bacterium]